METEFVNGPTVKCLYTCLECGVRKREVEIRERGQDEDVVAWVNFAAERCGEDHAAESPHCTAGKVDLYIPLPKGSVQGGKIVDPNVRIGAAPRQ